MSLRRRRDEYGSQDISHISWRCIGLGRLFGFDSLAAVLQVFGEFTAIDINGFPVFPPVDRAGEVVFQRQRLNGETVVGFVHEKADLPVYVPGAQVLRGCAEQNDLVVSSFQVVPQATGPLVVVAEAVGLVDQHRSTVGECIIENGPLLAGAGVFVVLCLGVEDQLRRWGNPALRKHGCAQLVTFVELIPHGDEFRPGR